MLPKAEMIIISYYDYIISYMISKEKKQKRYCLTKKSRRTSSPEKVLPMNYILLFAERSLDCIRDILRGKSELLQKRDCGARMSEHILYAYLDHRYRAGLGDNGRNS